MKVSGGCMRALGTQEQGLARRRPGCLDSRAPHVAAPSLWQNTPAEALIVQQSKTANPTAAARGAAPPRAHLYSR